MNWLYATYTHPICGCTRTQPFRVEILGDEQWPELQCGVCHCDLHTSDILSVSDRLVPDWGYTDPRGRAKNPSAASSAPSKGHQA